MYNIRNSNFSVRRSVHINVFTRSLVTPCFGLVWPSYATIIFIKWEFPSFQNGNFGACTIVPSPQKARCLCWSIARTCFSKSTSQQQSDVRCLVCALSPSTPSKCLVCSSWVAFACFTAHPTWTRTDCSSSL